LSLITRLRRSAAETSPADPADHPTPDPTDPSHATGQLLAAVREDLDPKKIVIATDSPAFTVKTEPSGERGYKVTVDWKRVTGSEPSEGTISLSVGDEVTKVPVRVNLARASAAAGG